MAAKQDTHFPVHMHCIQHSRFTKQDGWRLWDLSLSLSGNIAVTGYNENTRRTSLDVYSPVRNSDSRDKPKIFYSKEFDKYELEGMIYYGRRVSFVDSNDDNRGLVVVTGLGDKLEVFDLNQDRVLKSRKVTLVKPGDDIKCLSVREREIFIGFKESNKITVYDVTDLNEIKSIILQGFQDGYWPGDMTAITDRLFVCEIKPNEESNHRSLIFDGKNGRILSELTKPTDTHWYALSITVCVPLGVVAVVWFDSWYKREGDRHQIVFYSLFSANNSSFLIVEIKSDVFRIRISDRGDSMVMMNHVTGEVKVYDMAEVFTYSHLKEKLASTLQTDDCTNLANFFKIPRDQTDVILSSDKPSESLLLALEEKGVLQPYNVDGLIEAFAELKINPFCQHVAEIYQKTRAQSTSYGRFLATLSALLTASLPADLCDYFHFTDDKKKSITSSQNPGLSLLLALDEMGVIKVSEVGALEQPFTEMQMVQAVAKVHEYQSTVEEAESLFQSKDELTEEEKQHLFIQCLQKKIKSWYESMTPVPWKKSCRWRSTDLFVGGSLILTDTKPKRSLAAGDADVKMQYTEIFSHEKLKSEIRIILEGDPGSGKTMLMSQLAYDWCQGKFSEIGILVLLPLKFVEQKTIVQAVKDFYFPGHERFSLHDIEHLLLNEEISRCILLDGLEECSDTVTREEQTEVIQVMSKAKYPTCKVVMSLRSDYAQHLPKCPILKLTKFGDVERNSYIQEVFQDNPEQQMAVRKIIEENQFIAALCSTPVLFVMLVHNLENIDVSIAEINRVAPVVKSLVNALSPLSSLTDQLEMLALGDEIESEMSLGELAYNGLCRGYQQLYWPIEFIESRVSSSKEWIDSGILVVEECIPAISAVMKSYILSGSTAEKRGELKGAIEEGDSGSMDSEAAAGPKSDADSEVKSATEPDSSAVSIESTQSSSTTVKYVPLQVKFAHKIIQEWFAAMYLSTMLSRFRKYEYLQKDLTEKLHVINPSDLCFVLRFTIALYPPCCHIILKHLLETNRTKDGYLPKHVMDYIFLCFAEYDGELEHGILGAVTDVCKEEIEVCPEDSSLVQHAKVAMLELASKCGIKCGKLCLSDVLISATQDALHFGSGVSVKVLHTLEVLEVSDCDRKLTEEDCANVVKFIERCAWVRKACLNIPKHPPSLDEEIVVGLRESSKTVTWIMGPNQRQILNTSTGEWVSEDEMNLTLLETDGDTDIGWGEEPILEAEETISKEGGSIEIPKTGVKIDIPPDAFEEDTDQCNICVKIVPPDVSGWTVTDYTSDSSAIVELLPNNLTFQQPYKLTLPHCLQLKQGAEHKAKIFVSHHEEGTYPRWEEKTDVSYELTETTCTILLHSFCWVKYVIDGKTVEAKRVQLFAAGRYMSPSDSLYETELGFYPDTPAGGEKFRTNKNLIRPTKKTFLLHKEGECPLKFVVQQIIPSEWALIPDEEKRKEIPFENIDQSKESSCPFIFAKQSQEPLIPRFMFRAVQGDRGVRLLYRVEVRDDASVSTQTN